MNETSWKYVHPLVLILVPSDIDPSADEMMFLFILVFTRDLLPNDLLVACSISLDYLAVFLSYCHGFSSLPISSGTVIVSSSVFSSEAPCV